MPYQLKLVALAVPCSDTTVLDAGAAAACRLPPTQVRTMLWQYWFTDRATKRATGLWWRRRLLGPYAGVVSKDSLGRMVLNEAP